MGSVTIDIWITILGALAGLCGGLVAKGRGRLLKSAIAGAVAVVLATLFRSLL